MKKKPSGYVTASILLALFGLLLLAGGWIVHMLFNQAWTPYVVTGCFIGSLVLGFASIFVHLFGRGKDEKEAKRALEQLNNLRNGDLNRREVGSASESVQILSEAIDSLALSPAPTLLIPEGLLEEPEFHKALRASLDIIPSSRGALLVFELDGEGKPESREALKNAVRKEFPKSLFGLVDGHYAIYEPTVLSKEELQGELRRFVTSFVALENETSMKPTSFGARVGVAFYPGYLRDELEAAALAALAEAKPIAFAEEGESEPTPLTRAESVRKVSLPYEEFERALSKAADESARKKALRLFMVKAGLTLGFDVLGVAIYDKKRHAYRILEEIHAEGKANAFKLLQKDGLVADDRIDPYYDLARGENLLFIGDALHFDSRPAAILDSLGMRSLAAKSIGDGSHKIGFVYLANATPTEAPDYERQEAILRFFRALSDYALYAYAFHRVEEEHRMINLLTEGSLRYSYEIDMETHRILSMSDNLLAAYPDVKAGHVCHKALLGEDKPCPNCPLVHDGGFRKALAPLGPGLLSFSALSKAPSAVIVLDKQHRDMTSRRLDPKLFVFNRRALMADLEAALLKEGTGSLLLFRIENALMSAGKIKGGTVDDVMASVLSRLSQTSLEEGIYRYDDNVLGYLLPDTSKEEAFKVAELVAIALSTSLPLQDRTFDPELSYYLFDYPVEVSTTFDLESLLRTCMSRVASLGKGRVIPFEGNDAPLVSPRAFREDAIKKAVSQGAFPLCFNLIRENSSNRVRFVEVSAGLELTKGTRSSGEEIRSYIREERMLAKLEEGELASFFAFYKKNAKALKASAVKGAIFTIGKSSLFSPTYMRILSRGIKDAHVPGNYIRLRIPVEFTDEEQEKLQAALKNLHSAGVALIQQFASGDLGGSLAYLSEEAVLTALYQKEGEVALNATLEEAKAMGCALIAQGIDTQRAQSYAISLAIPYGKGEEYGKNVDEEELLKAIG